MKRTMSKIEYRVTYGEGLIHYYTVEARSINAGFRKALSAAARANPGAELHSVEFYGVIS